MIMGPNDPRAIVGAELEEARAVTEKWNEMLGFKPLSKRAQKAKAERLTRILDEIEYGICAECGEENDDNIGFTMCKTCEDWIATE